MSDNDKKSRYPGLAPFNELQGKLFFGRDKEKAEIYNFTVAEQTIVLFAKSGAGKSSLLHAGLFPLLRANGYHPVKVRFQYTVEYDKDKPAEPQVRRTPLRILFDTLEQRSEDKEDVIRISKQDILFNKDEPKLWEYIKVIQLPSVVVQAQPVMQEEAAVAAASEGVDGGGTGFRFFGKPKGEIKQTPVLVFDQFEEFFNFPEHERHEFMLQLCEVLHNLCPNRISQWLRGFKLSERTPQMMEWAKQPVVKCIIAIRDDKLSELDSLRKYIPLILKNRYKLSALAIDNARQAMEEPASLEGDFRSPRFSFDKQILDKILIRLTGNEPEEKMFAAIAAPATASAPADESLSVNDKGIDGSQLQKVCSFIERKVALQAIKKKTIIVDKNFINPDVDVQNILDGFYEDQLKTVGSSKDIAVCKRLIEERLVSGGARASLTENQMKEHLKGKEYLVGKMIEARLIKEEYTHLGKTYELSHDTLVKSVARFARDVKTRRQRRYVIFFSVLSIISILSLVAAIILGSKVYRSLNANNLQLAEAYYQQNNHYVAYNIWDDFTDRTLVSAAKKDSIQKQLDTLFFFDISGGKKMVNLTDWQLAVHENDNTIHVWKIPGNGGKLEVKTLENAFNMEVSDSKRYIGYRTYEGRLMIYDVQADTTFTIKEAVGAVADKDQRSRNADRETDYKMNFLRGADIIGYIDTAGEAYLYNLDARSKVRLRIRKIEDSEFYSDFIVSRMKVSTDKKFVAIHKKDTFTVWNIEKPAELPFRVYSEPQMDAAYFYADGNSVCYQKADSLILIPFENFSKGGSGLRTRMVGFPDFSPDLKKCLFYNRAYELVVLDLETNRTDTLRDYNNTNRSRRRLQEGSSFRARWLDGGGRIMYYDKDLQEITIALKDMRQVPELSSYSPDGKFYCWLKSSGLLRVFDRQTGKVVFTDSLHLDSAMVLDMYGRMKIGNEVLRFSSSGDLLAYQVRNGINDGFLKVVDLTTAAVKYQSKGLWRIGDFFNRYIINVYDDAGNPGLIFLTDRERKSSYFRSLYPTLTKQDRKRLGVNHFIDIF
ncbi:MAG: hypothetical protein WCF67_07835 [Chitinophagaceae bacterium]